MEWITVDGETAPRLAQTRPEPDAAGVVLRPAARGAGASWPGTGWCTATSRRTTCWRPASGWSSSTCRRWSTWSATRPGWTSCCATAPTCAAWFRARGLEVDEHDAVRRAGGARLLSRDGPAGGSVGRMRQTVAAAWSRSTPSRTSTAGSTAGARTLRGWRLRSLDLRGARRRAAPVAGWRARCSSAAASPTATRRRCEDRGAVVFPTRARTCRSTPTAAALYTARRALRRRRATPTASTPAPTRGRESAPRPRRRCSPQALHDHAIDDALAAWVAGRSAGRRHGRARAAARRAGVRRRGAARAALLAGRHIVATGGGPGAMEAANLGARLAGRPGEALDAALARLAGGADVPARDRRVGARRRSTRSDRGLRRHRHPRASRPGTTATSRPTSFATAIAKYFRNAIREAILLEVCDAGIVFLPGAAGTVQEVFQDACENYYADAVVGRADGAGRPRATGPRTLPVWPLLQRLARGRADGAATSTSSTPSRRPPRSVG